MISSETYFLKYLCEDLVIKFWFREIWCRNIYLEKLSPRTNKKNLDRRDRSCTEKSTHLVELYALSSVSAISRTLSIAPVQIESFPTPILKIYQPTLALLTSGFAPKCETTWVLSPFPPQHEKMKQYTTWANKGKRFFITRKVNLRNENCGWKEVEGGSEPKWM